MVSLKNDYSRLQHEKAVVKINHQRLHLFWVKTLFNTPILGQKEREKHVQYLLHSQLFPLNWSIDNRNTVAFALPQSKNHPVHFSPSACNKL